MTKTFLAGAALFGLVLGGCAALGPGERQAEVPPRLVLLDNVVTWDNPSAFGPVPAQLQEAGQKLCGSLDTREVQFKAIGYHARAMDVNGNLLPGGGYYCVRK